MTGCRVRLMVSGIVPGEMIQGIVRDQWIGELHKLGVEMVPYMRFHGADANSAYFQHQINGEAIDLRRGRYGGDLQRQANRRTGCCAGSKSIGCSGSSDWGLCEPPDRRGGGARRPQGRLGVCERVEMPTTEHVSQTNGGYGA